MVKETKTTEEMRAILKDKGITTNNVNHAQLKALHKILSIKLRDSGLLEGTYRMNELSAGDHKYMTCRAYYFEAREAVSFNRDGFIGVAGWADSKNVAPLIEGVLEWAEIMALEAST